jgi:inner membrane protease subunit 1
MVLQAGGPSMLPTMSIVEYVLEEKIRHEWYPQTLHRGDVVTYLSPINPHHLICKRILGLPGDVVLVDPTTLPDPSRVDASSQLDGAHVKVPKGHVWVQGDNATASRDSRMYGPVPISLIRGRLICGIGVCVAWPLEHLF